MVMIDMAYVARSIKATTEHPALHEVASERARQDDLWGEQNHPVLDPANTDADRDYYYSQATAWKFENQTRKENGRLAWDGILLEEVFEALESDDPAAQRAELIQVAAVALAAAESLDRAAAKLSIDTETEAE